MLMSTHENLHQGPKRLYNAFLPLRIRTLSTSPKKTLLELAKLVLRHIVGGGKDAIIKTEGDPTLPILTP